jgi:hypothetical protein
MPEYVYLGKFKINANSQSIIRKTTKPAMGSEEWKGYYDKDNPSKKVHVITDQILSNLQPYELDNIKYRISCRDTLQSLNTENVNTAASREKVTSPDKDDFLVSQFDKTIFENPDEVINAVASAHISVYASEYEAALDERRHRQQQQQQHDLEQQQQQQHEQEEEGEGIGGGGGKRKSKKKRRKTKNKKTKNKKKSKKRKSRRR